VKNHENFIFSRKTSSVDLIDVMEFDAFLPFPSHIVSPFRSVHDCDYSLEILHHIAADGG
jgi:hypothetical protein